MEEIKEPIDIIILNFNGLEFSKGCINSLYNNTDYPFNLIIVDNASEEEGTEEYFESLKKKYNNVIIHYNKTPDSGFAGGNNIGLSYSKHDYVMLLNNDILIPGSNKLWLRELKNIFKLDTKIAIVGPKLLYPNNLIQSAGSYLDKNTFSAPVFPFYHRGRFESKEKYSQIDELSCITFACILAKRELLGFLDEEYKIGTFEDNDKCMEIRSKGYKIYYNGKIELYHYEGATLYKKPRDLLSKLMNENYLIFQRRWIEQIKSDLKIDPKIYGW
uniref:Putative glycosyltransferase n=1 Tax=viral metagenome TaxID=1070528 RepID=A0A6M3XPT8_9ZZZZ